MRPRRLRRGRFTSLLASTCGVLTHLVFIPVPVGLYLHLILFKRNWIKTHLFSLISSLSICFCISLPYLLHLVSEKRSFSSGGVAPNLGHLLMPFLGPRFFTSLGIEHFTGKDWYLLFPENFYLNSIWLFLLALSALAYPVAWYGGYLSFKEVYRNLKNRPLNPEKSEYFDLCFISVSIFVIELVLSFYLRLIPIPNFYSPFWILFFFFIWLGFTALWNKLTTKIIFVLIAFSLLTGLTGLVWQLHINGGNRWNHYGPTLSNLISVAKEIEELSPNTQVSSDTFHLSQFPLMMESLRSIIRPTIQNPLTTSTLKFEIQYAEPNNLHSGRVVLIKNKNN